jgi:hypothetical protein
MRGGSQQKRKEVRQPFHCSRHGVLTNKELSRSLLVRRPQLGTDGIFQGGIYGLEINARGYQLARFGNLDKRRHRDSNGFVGEDRSREADGWSLAERGGIDVDVRHLRADETDHHFRITVGRSIERLRRQRGWICRAAQGEARYLLYIEEVFEPVRSS